MVTPGTNTLLQSLDETRNNYIMSVFCENELFGVAVCMNGHLYVKLPWYVRVAYLAAGLLLLDPGIATDVIGLVVIVGLTLLMRYKRQRSSQEPAA